MSATGAFRFEGAFPFCVGDESGLGLSYIDNLTLAQVMAFAWNLETFTISITGSATKGAASVTATGDVTSNPPTATNYDRGGGNGMWLPTVASNTVWASWPAAKQPYERVCNNVDDQICFFSGNHSSAPLSNFFQIAFYVGTDLVNAGKYRIYYGFALTVTGTSGGDSVQIIVVDPSTSPSGTLWNSGSLTIGGLTFDWESYYTTGATPSGTGAVSASSGNYTYV